MSGWEFLVEPSLGKRNLRCQQMWIPDLIRWTPYTSLRALLDLNRWTLRSRQCTMLCKCFISNPQYDMMPRVPYFQSANFLPKLKFPRIMALHSCSTVGFGNSKAPDKVDGSRRCLSQESFFHALVVGVIMIAPCPWYWNLPRACKDAIFRGSASC